MRSWEYHGVPGWYVAPAPEHYRCIKVYIPSTHKERITDTAKIIPRDIPIPEMTVQDHLKKTADDLIHLLYNTPTTIMPTSR